MVSGTSCSLYVPYMLAPSLSIIASPPYKIFRAHHTCAAGKAKRPRPWTCTDMTSSPPIKIDANIPGQVNQSLLFRIDKSSLGVPRIGVATPWDDCPYAKSNANTFVRARAYRVFLTSCVGINLGDIPRGLRHPWDVPSVDPSTLGLKTLYELASLKYCYNVHRLGKHRPLKYSPCNLRSLE